MSDLWDGSERFTRCALSAELWTTRGAARGRRSLDLVVLRPWFDRVRSRPDGSDVSASRDRGARWRFTASRSSELCGAGAVTLLRRLTRSGGRDSGSQSALGGGATGCGLTSLQLRMCQGVGSG